MKSLLSFALLIGFFWFFPDIYLWSRNVSNALFQEAANVAERRVEIKVSLPIPFLPIRFGVLAKGEKDYQVELYSQVLRRAYSASTIDGTALILGLVDGEYMVRIAKTREFGDLDMRRHRENGEPLLVESELLETSLDLLQVEGDLFAVAVVTEE